MKASFLGICRDCRVVQFVLKKKSSSKDLQHRCKTGSSACADSFCAKAHQDPRQMVLPFAVAERDFGPFAALRSQNYSNFLGREGVTFQDIDQSPFQKMCFFLVDFA